MATTQSIHMGPEWMRPQPASQTTINPLGKNPSSQPPPLAIVPNAPRHAEGLKTSATAAAGTNAERSALGSASTPQAAPAPGTSSSGTTPAIPYSSLLNSGSSHQTLKTTEILDGGNQAPFRYSRDQLISIWRNGTTSHGGLGWSLGIEVERYEGIVLDFEAVPACSRELTDAEQKVYSQGSLNSRRPSISHTLSDYRRDDHIRRGTALNGDGDLTGLGVLGRRGTGDGLSLATSGKGFGSFVTNGPLSPMKDRFARRDSNQTGTTYRSRQPSFGTTGLTGDRDAASSSPRGPGAFNFGGGTSFGVLSTGDGWGGRRKTGALADVGRTTNQRDKIQESDEFAQRDNPQSNQQSDETIEPLTVEPEEIKEDKVESASLDNWEDDSEIADDGAGIAVGTDKKVVNGDGSGESPSSVLAKSPPGLGTNGVNIHMSKQPTPPPVDPVTVKWCYYDDNKNIQGPFTPDQLKLWYSSGWLRPNLVMLRTEYDKSTFQLSEWQTMVTTRGIKTEEMFHIWHAPVTSAADLLSLPVAPQKEEPKPASIPSAPVSSVAQSDIGSPARSVFASITSTSAQRPSTSSLLSVSRGKPRANEVDPNSDFNPLSPARIQARSGTVDNSSAGSPASVNASTTDSILGGGGMANGGVFVRGPGAIGSAVSSGQSPFSNYHPAAGRFGTADPIHAFSGNGLGYGNGFSGFEDPLVQRLPSGTYARTYDHSAITSPHQLWSQSIGAGTPASYGRTTATFGGRRSESPIPSVGALGGDIYDVTGSSRGIDSAGLGIGQQPPQRYISRLPLPHEQQLRRSQDMFGTYPVTSAQIGSVQPTQPPAPLPLPPVVKNDEEVMSRPKGPLDQELIPTILPNSPVHPIPEGSLIQKSKPQPQLQTQTQPSGQEAPAPAPILSAPALTSVPSATPLAPAVVDDPNQPFTQVKNKKHHHPQSQVAQIAAPAPIQPAPSKVEHASNNPPATVVVPLASLIPHAVSSPSTSSAPKTAWATPTSKDDAVKSLTLKEIQEAEEKRAKEEAARQKAVAASTLPISVNALVSGKSDEVEHLTWGLPTSKAGSRPNTTPTATSTGGGKDVSASGPVWATGSKGGISAGATTTKKTMKEIQEEEERRRRREKEVNATTAAKKVTESNKTPAPTPPTTTGSAWSTVGAGGKVNSAPVSRPTGLAALPPKPTAAVAAASRPSTVSAPLFSTAASVGMPTRKVTPSPANRPTVALAKSVEEPQEPPVSAETTRWMKDSLQRGLKPGSSVDVIVGMVLSIQEEEFIADIIYQSSETMDGRRWAAELLSRRKADAASTSSASGTSGRAGSTSGSMAEVLKAQPKQLTQDIGYKVVKKKGKNGRA